MKVIKGMLLALAGVAVALGCSRNDATSHLDSSMASIDWYFNCPNNPDKWQHPPSDTEHLRIDDGGPVTGFYRRQLFGTPVSVHGTLCAPPKVERDVIFVIDVSGSMSDSDPEVTDPADSSKQTCGRLQALEALFGVLDPTTMFAVGTFDDGIEDKSTKFFGNKTDLYADLEKQNTSSKKYYDIICNAASGTNYDAGMQFASDTFKTGRPEADFTLIFLSDGEPNDGQDGVAIAATLKNPGVPVNNVNKPVIIGSVILGDADPTAIQAVASIDPVTGLPIFAKADPTDLAYIVTTLANNINSAQLQHGGDAETQAAVNILPVLSFTTFKFELQPFQLNIDRTQPKYDLAVKYADFEGNLSTAAGSITWLDD